MQCALEVVGEVGATGILSVLWAERPEGVLVRSERKRLTGLHFAIGVQAKEHKVAVGADQDLAVACQVTPDLGRACDSHDVLCRTLDLHNTTLGCSHKERGITGLSNCLAGDKEATVWYPGTAVLGGQHAGDHRGEGLPDLIKKSFELSVVGGLRDGFTGQVNSPQAFEVGT